MIRRAMLAVMLMVAGAVSLVAAVPQTALADACSDKGKILTIQPWYRGLTEGAECSIKSPKDMGISAFVWTIGLNVAEALLQVTAYVAVGFVLYGGFVFMTSGGAPDRAAAGRKTVMNALIGMVIAISAVVLVNLIARTALGIR